MMKQLLSEIHPNRSTHGKDIKSYFPRWPP